MPRKRSAKVRRFTVIPRKINIGNLFEGQNCSYYFLKWQQMTMPHGKNFSDIISLILKQLTEEQKIVLLNTQYIPWRRMYGTDFVEYLQIILRQKKILFLNEKLILERLTNLLDIDAQPICQDKNDNKEKMMDLINENSATSHIAKCFLFMQEIHSIMQKSSNRNEEICKLLDRYSVAAIVRYLPYFRDKISKYIIQNILKYIPASYFQDFEKEKQVIQSVYNTDDEPSIIPRASCVLSFLYNALGKDKMYDIVSEYGNLSSEEIYEKKQVVNQQSPGQQARYFGMHFYNAITWEIMDDLCVKNYEVSATGLFYSTVAYSPKCNIGYKETSLMHVHSLIHKAADVNRITCVQYAYKVIVCTLGIGTIINMIPDALFEDISSILQMYSGQNTTNTI